MNLDLAWDYGATHEVLTTLELPAAAIISSTAASIMLTPRHAFSQLPKIRQNLRPVFSRASCFWSHCKTSQHPTNQLFRKRWSENRIEVAGLFSTSAVQRSRPDDARRQPTKTPMDRGTIEVCFIIVLSYLVFPVHSSSITLQALFIFFSLDDALAPAHVKENLNVVPPSLSGILSCIIAIYQFQYRCT